MGTRGKDRRLEGWPQAFLRILALALLAATASAQTPVINEGGLVNGASFAPVELSSGAIAQGSIFSLFGLEFSDGAARAVDFPLPKELLNVRVEVIANSTVYEVPLLYVSPLQINGIFPSDVPVGPAQVRVIRSGQTSNVEPVKVVQTYPGIYIAQPVEQAYSNLRQLAAAQRQASGEVQQLLQDRPAYPGGVVTLWGTGLGGVPGGDDWPVIVMGRPVSAVRVLVDGKEVEILYQSRASCCVGLDQINIRLPADVGLSCHVPVQLVGGGLPSNIAMIPIAESETQFCPGRELRPTRVYLDRRWEDGVPSDRARTFRGRDSWDPYEIPPTGSCQVYGNGFSGVLVDDVIEDELVEVEGPVSIFQLSEGSGVLRYAPEGAAQLGAGLYRVTSTGGNFPAYEATLSVPAWSFSTNDLSLQVNARDDGLRFEWEGLSFHLTSDPTETVGIISVYGRLTCAIDLSADSFTVLPEVLALVKGPTDWSFGAIAYAPIETETDGPETGFVVYSELTDQRVDIGPVRLPTIPVYLPNTEVVHAEIATTAAEHQRGLMNRPALAPDRGMLLFFAALGFHSFWMAETLIPLDIIWLDSNRNIVTISANTPPCPPDTACRFYGPDVPAMYVLELAAGEAARRGLKVNDQINW